MSVTSYSTPSTQDCLFESVSVGDEFSMVAALLKERGYTVQPQTNGIIAAMLREGTRQVTFKWADMSFTGYLQEASARYTMFSVSGKPVRSMVRINITQYVPRLAEGKYWNDAFDKLFGDASTSKVSGGKGFGSDYQNLVNLSFSGRIIYDPIHAAGGGTGLKYESLKEKYGN